MCFTGATLDVQDQVRNLIVVRCGFPPRMLRCCEACVHRQWGHDARCRAEHPARILVMALSLGAGHFTGRLLLFCCVFAPPPTARCAKDTEFRCVRCPLRLAVALITLPAVLVVTWSSSSKGWVLARYGHGSRANQCDDGSPHMPRRCRTACPFTKHGLLSLRWATVRETAVGGNRRQSVDERLSSLGKAPVSPLHWVWLRLPMAALGPIAPLGDCLLLGSGTSNRVTRHQKVVPQVQTGH